MQFLVDFILVRWQIAASFHWTTFNNIRALYTTSAIASSHLADGVSFAFGCGTGIDVGFTEDRQKLINPPG